MFDCSVPQLPEHSHKITSLQFPATPLRRFFFFRHLRTRCWVLISVSLQFPATSLHGSRIQLRIHRDIRSIRNKRRGSLSVQVSWNQTHWPLLCYRRFFFRLPSLNSLRHGDCVFNPTKMAAREHRKFHDVDVEQKKKIAPFITRETPLQFCFPRWRFSLSDSWPILLFQFRALKLRVLIVWSFQSPQFLITRRHAISTRFLVIHRKYCLKLFGTLQLIFVRPSRTFSEGISLVPHKIWSHLVSKSWTSSLCKQTLNKSYRPWAVS